MIDRIKEAVKDWDIVNKMCGGNNKTGNVVYSPLRNDGKTLSFFDNIIFYNRSGEICVTFNVYAFIFSTELGFLEALVNKPACMNCGHKFVLEKSVNDKNYIRCRKNDTWRCDPAPCDEFKISKDAHYHREKLSNMTLDEMVEYIDKL